MTSERDTKHCSEQKASTRPTGHFDEKDDNIFYIKSLCEKNCPLSDYKNLDPTYEGKDTKLCYCECVFTKALDLRWRFKQLSNVNNTNYAYSIRTLEREIRLRKIFQDKFVPVDIKSDGHIHYLHRLNCKIDRLNSLGLSKKKKEKNPYYFPSSIILAAEWESVAKTQQMFENMTPEELARWNATSEDGNKE